MESIRGEKSGNGKNKIYVIIITFIFSALFFLNPIFKNFSYWGQMDWDQFTFWNAVPRLTILKYHQFPLWNPYANGGNVLLAHPHSSFLSPFYILVLLFGPVTGLKLEIIIHLIIGLLGMFLLSIHMKVGRVSSYLSSFIYMLSSIYALHLTEGHTEWLAMAFVPWLFLYYLKSFNTNKYILAGILFLALIILAGSVDVLSITIILFSIYAILTSFQRKDIVPLRTLVFVFLGVFLLCSVKLVPMCDFLFQYPRLSKGESGINLFVLSKILLSKEQATYDLVSEDGIKKMLKIEYGWHEYGAYIGIIPLLLFFAGVILCFRERWPLIITGISCLFIAMGNKSPINLWGVVHSIPLYNFLHVPSRFILGFIFCISLVSGFACSRLEELARKNINIKLITRGRLLVLTIVLFVFFDLYSVNSVIFRNAFRIPPMELKENAAFCQKYKNVNFYGGDLSYSSEYPVFLSNGGIIDAYEVVNIAKGNVLSVDNPGYKGEAHLVNSNGSAAISSFSPNKIVVDVNAKGQDMLVLNQNYHVGWRVAKDQQHKHASYFGGLISTIVSAGEQKVTFYYMPFSFVVGFFITAVFIAVLLLKKIQKKGGRYE